MPYLNMDDKFPEHEKIDQLSDGAFRLWTSGLAYCARETTDGRIPHRRVSRLVPNHKPSQNRELIRAGLWHEGGDGCGTDECPTGDPGEFIAHDYLQWNKSREWWADRRKKESERVAEWRKKNGNKKGLRAV